MKIFIRKTLMINRVIVSCTVSLSIIRQHGCKRSISKCNRSLSMGVYQKYAIIKIDVEYNISNDNSFTTIILYQVESFMKWKFHEIIDKDQKSRYRSINIKRYINKLKNKILNESINVNAKPKPQITQNHNELYL
ncbi:hypothetical protein V1477_007976 [Vespula maculifrons]|uniref:Uncharacterized protein n=1 Tax=Vespula maculifrons TaxID=7453 RepID=A0ABD2CHK4_VESMC